MKNKTDKIILGIDPGTRILGFGVIRVLDRKVEYLHMGVVNLKGTKDHFVTLRTIYEEVTKIIEKYNPDELAVEAPFYGKNVQVMLKLGRAQGAAIAAAIRRDIPIFEYAPRSIKLAVTGKGAASKEQVAMMAQRLLGIDIAQEYLDATDALAIALCHHYHVSNPVLAAASGSRKGGKKMSGSWEQFVESNPGRVK
ncbi:MAG: crossover junction endodeoxyribonuclease RuvC [Bacteroidales bacterium]|nr:crossover junction endodeoxyribonuclease RuvC [Bacteroidales bacterium]